MSGGSGSRVNAYTLSYIKLQQEERERTEQELASDVDDAGMQEEPSSDGMQDEQGDIDPFEQLDSLEQQDEPATDIPLDAVPSIDERDEDDYASMPEGAIINTKIFGINTSQKMFNPQYEDETHRVLARAFAPGCTADLAQLRSTIAEKSNYEVCAVIRLKNRAVEGMHRQFKTSFKIKQTTRVYHGTADAHADSIANVGFRGAAFQRAQFGRGIYSSPNAYHALAYAKPTSLGYMTFLVVDLHLGPMALGRKDQVFHCPLLDVHTTQRPDTHKPQVDFGQNAEGEPILTLTNLEADIYCASSGMPQHTHPHPPPPTICRYT